MFCSLMDSGIFCGILITLHYQFTSKINKITSFTNFTSPPIKNNVCYWLLSFSILIPLIDLMSLGIFPLSLIITVYPSAIISVILFLSGMYG